MPRSDSKIGAILKGNNLFQKGARADPMVQKQIFYVNDTLLLTGTDNALIIFEWFLLYLLCAYILFCFNVILFNDMSIGLTLFYFLRSNSVT